MKNFINIEELNQEQNNALNIDLIKLLSAKDEMSDMEIEKVENFVQETINIHHKINKLNFEYKKVEKLQAGISARLEKIKTVWEQFLAEYNKAKEIHFNFSNREDKRFEMKRKKIERALKHNENESNRTYKIIENLKIQQEELNKEYEEWKSCFCF